MPQLYRQGCLLSKHVLTLRSKEGPAMTRSLMSGMVLDGTLSQLPVRATLLSNRHVAFLAV